jgi:hypothetical protein
MSNYRLDLKTSASKVHLPEVKYAKAEARVAAARKLKSHLKILLSVPFVVCILYFGSLLYNHVRVVPTGVETVQDFYQRYGNPPKVESINVSGRRYYRITGEIPAPLGFPKGSPLYVFDDTGRLVDWTAESGNDPSFSSRWSDAPASGMNVAYFLEKFPPN